VNKTELSATAAVLAQEIARARSHAVSCNGFKQMAVARRETSTGCPLGSTWAEAPIEVVAYLRFLQVSPAPCGLESTPCPGLPPPTRYCSIRSLSAG
jgi:hypothetical protein